MNFKDGFCTDGQTDGLFERFYSLVFEYNQKVNITAITERREFYIKHLWDSVAGQKFFKEGANAAEVGSGGGFPSIPLKICRPDIKFTQFESVAKKCVFLREAEQQLGLEGMSVVNARAEDAGRDFKYRERFDVCCALAVARLNTLLEYCAPLVKKGGLFVAYKGAADEEIAEAGHAAEVLGMKLECAEKYSLPEDMGERTLVVYVKTRSTPTAYPRGNGKERKNPL